MEQLLTQFLDHLRYERNVSEHTLRNYQSDLEQFLDYLAPADPRRGRERTADSPQSITSRFANGSRPSTRRKRRKLRSLASSLPCAPFFSFWCAKACSSLIRPSSSRRRVWKRSCRNISPLRKRSSLSRRRTRKPIWASAIGPCWN